MGSAPFTDIGAATAAAYTFTPSADDDGREFRAVFTNTVGTAVSNAAVLTIQDGGPTETAPVITAHPASQSVVAGTAVTFTASASGNPTPSVQWQSRSGSAAFADIAGARSTSYTLTATTLDDGVQFRALFMNSAGSAATNAAVLTVSCAAVSAPAVTQHPANLQSSPGTEVLFRAAATGCPVPTARWDESTDNGSTWREVTSGRVENEGGQTRLFYTFPNGYRSGLFRAVFTNGAGTATTNVGSLVVYYPAVVTKHPSSVVVVAGSSVTLSAAATADTPIQVSWQRATASGYADGYGHECPAVCSTEYSIAPNLSDNGAAFRVRFTVNIAGSTYTDVAILTVNAPPVITTHPASRTVAAGATVTFSAAATGNPTPTVQWQVSTNGGASFTTISGATSTTYSFAAAASDTGKQFRAVFTNSLNSATTSAAVLTVN